MRKDPKIAMPDIPHTWREYNRQKGPIPLTAIFLALGLIAVFILFFLPVLSGDTLPTELPPT